MANFSPTAVVAPTQRHLLLTAQAARPTDPWPRGTGHIVLALPGSREEEKGYHEPGGAFSPGVGSCGLAIWVRDAQGRLLATSDDLPLAQLTQELIWAPGATIPAIRTTTPHYVVQWSCVSPGTWLAEIEARDAQTVLEIAVRSAGPAGGPVQKITWSDATLRVNERYVVSAQPLPTAVSGGREDDVAWVSARASLTSITDAGDGWCWARLQMATGQRTTLTVRDGQTPTAPDLARLAQAPALSLDLPDARFSASLQAQVAHLLMGLVRDETRPGEPTNYPLTWLRDGAYVVAAMARSGQIDVAKRLARRFAEHDFFGGFGAEGDNPGLALWCLDEVSAVARDPAFDAWLWPHVLRKAAWIERLASTTSTIRSRDFPGPLVPYLIEDPAKAKDLGLIAEPARDGLVYGRMDHHLPALFTTAASHRGLHGAVNIARRLGHDEHTAAWQALAERLQSAWNRALSGPEGDNERTAMCGMWPGEVVTERDAYAALLDRRWQAEHDAHGNLHKVPLWTYFTFAEAHQWLRLGRPDRVWSTLEWFWAHEPSPGLYAWWEGDGEENAFRRWEAVRGWTTPPHVVPHYWSAATALLLQLGMLGYSDHDTLVVGGGVPAAWLTQPFAIANLPTALGTHSWRWDGHTVTIDGPRCPIALGSAFPQGTPVRWG